MHSLINVHSICLDESRMVCQGVVRGVCLSFFNLGGSQWWKLLVAKVTYRTTP